MSSRDGPSSRHDSRDSRGGGYGGGSSRRSRSPDRRGERGGYGDRDRERSSYDRDGRSGGEGGRSDYRDRDGGRGAPPRSGSGRDRDEWDRDRDRDQRSSRASDRDHGSSRYSRRSQSPPARSFGGDFRSGPRDVTRSDADGRRSNDSPSAASGGARPRGDGKMVVNIRPEPAREPAVELPPDGQVEGVDGEWMEDEEEEGEGGEDAAAAAMAAMMGFGGFGSSKGKHVPSNQNGDVVIVKPRTWRQYMNRKGGFNRPLDKIK